MAKDHRRPAQEGPGSEHSAAGSAASTAPETNRSQAGAEEAQNGALGAKIATVAAVGVAAALIEVEWIPGLLLGVAAMMAPNLVPKIGQGLRPLIKGAVRAGYSVAERTRETVAEASEQLQDIVAEVRAEKGPVETAPAGAGAHSETAAEHS